MSLISIFNGRSRSLGEGGRKDIYLQVHVAFRRHLHLFKGAKLAVFQSIALHSDEHGWAWPTVSLIHRETGYRDDAIYAALNELEKVEIKGKRVLLRTKTPPAHFAAPADGNYSRNFYLIFPSAEEIRKYAEGARAAGKNPARTNKENHLGKTGYGFSESEKPDTDFPGTKKNKGSSYEEPKQEEPHTHKQNQAQPGLFAGGGGGGVCVSSKFSLEERRKYARNQTPPLGNGWLVTGADGRYDELIALWFAEQGRPDGGHRPDDRCGAGCPRCFGSGMEVVPGRGARKCPGAGDSPEEIAAMRAEYEAAQDELREGNAAR